MQREDKDTSSDVSAFPFDAPVSTIEVSVQDTSSRSTRPKPTLSQLPYRPLYYPYAPLTQSATDSPLEASTLRTPSQKTPQRSQPAKKTMVFSQAQKPRSPHSKLGPFTPKPPHCKQLVIGEGDENTSPNKPTSVFNNFFDYSGLQFTVEQQKEGYFCRPSCEELHRMITRDKKVVVPELLIGRKNIANLQFTNISLRHVVLRELKIGKSCVQLDSSIPEGMGLNSHVLVEILNVWPTAPLENFQVKVEQITMAMGGKLVLYDPATGTWQFEIPHF